MLSKNQIKLIKSLGQKKYRQQLNLFTVEGVKGINEFLNSDYELETLYTTELVFEASNNQIQEISEFDLKRITSLKNPNTALALFKIPQNRQPLEYGLKIALDAIRDPGNLGTIIRLCDWYGVQDLICNTNTVDCYNSKVVQATMGSLTRVNVTYLNLETYLTTNEASVFGTFMTGENVYTSDLPKEGVIVLGNEGNGISQVIETKINRKLTIPQFGNLEATESLNVANATAIILSEFRRRSIEM
ncbi:TrmH family RNA methyltransferase [Winogradskyella sp. UBA3174]|uniref:TrmH family RNA methyltransferase n=1 Tax=Winogradskyella sp. UBA3174 TaxID=1947785 RepID=UPI0025D0D389|nr:RNA methyltransferase [Winogradskyella sp. UBA3174]|tara:strand:+ start:7424 stop:8158 length:735 start_codon:yes stop_codon:yes gene_type:complete